MARSAILSAVQRQPLWEMIPMVVVAFGEGRQPR